MLTHLPSFRSRWRQRTGSSGSAAAPSGAAPSGGLGLCSPKLRYLGSCRRTPLAPRNSLFPGALSKGVAALGSEACAWLGGLRKWLFPVPRPASPVSEGWASKWPECHPAGWSTEAARLPPPLGHDRRGPSLPSAAAGLLPWAHPGPWGSASLRRLRCSRLLCPHRALTSCCTWPPEASTRTWTCWCRTSTGGPTRPWG